MSWRAAALLLLSTIQSPQAQRAPAQCSGHIASFPLKLRDDLPVDQRGRFELRECGGGMVQVLGFEPGRTLPQVTIDTQDVWPRHIVHRQNVLVLQTIGGSSSAVYILAFTKGKFAKPIIAATRGEMVVRMEREGQVVRVDVPAEPRTTSYTPARTYKVEVE